MKSRGLFSLSSLGGPSAGEGDTQKGKYLPGFLLRHP